MLDEIADSMEQSLFEQQLPQWCHSRGGSYYLDGCTATPPPDTTPLSRVSYWADCLLCWSARSLGGWWQMKGRIDRGLVFAYPRLPLSIVARRLGPLIERLNIDPPRITWWRKCTNPSMDTNWYWLFAQLFFCFHMLERGSVWNGLLWCHNSFFLSVSAAKFFFSVHLRRTTWPPPQVPRAAVLH